jgi:hypothetical protein
MFMDYFSYLKHTVNFSTGQIASRKVVFCFVISDLGRVYRKKIKYLIAIK